jgi:hypothetical protein
LKILIARRLARFHLPSAALIALLQRTPALRWAAAAGETVLAAPAGSLLKSSLAAVASLGAIDALAGATTYSVQTTNNTPNPYTVATGTNVTPGVAFVVTSNVGTQPVIGSWVVSSPIPPGMQFGSNSTGGYALTAAQTANAATSPVFINVPTPVLFGTPTTPGTYPINLLAANGNNGSAGAYPTYSFTFTMIVTGAAIAPPTFSVQPVSQTIASGSTVVFTAVASGGSAPTYQWSRNGTAIAGATGSTLLIGGATSANAGTYSCAATNSSGTTTSSSATLAVVSTSNVGRLTNISTRASVGTGANILIAGFVIGGAGTSGSEAVLIRGTGPELAGLGVSGTLPDPQLTLFNTLASGASVQIAQNTGWGGNPLIVSADAALGAYPLATTPTVSKDSALYQANPGLASGAYSAQVAGASGDSGVALVELYDATPAGSYTPASPRLINISSRAVVGTGANVLIAGIVVGGSTAKTVLIRASGPALAGFGVPGALPDPQLTLSNSSGTAIATNTGWAGNAQIAATATSVGAFAWNASSADSALLVTLAPGNYTAQISGASGDTGVALIEVYDVP